MAAFPKRRALAGVGAAMVTAGIATACTATAGAQSPANARLRFVVEARQLGPVGYRDPVGAMSPDGQWLAYASEGRLRLSQVSGGPVTTVGPAGGRITGIAWLPDSRRVAVLQSDARGSIAWWIVDVHRGERRRLWTDPFPTVVIGRDSIAIDPNRFRDIAWTSDGSRLAGVVLRASGSVLWTGKPDGTDARAQPSPMRLSSPAWSPDGKTLACLAMAGGRQFVSLPCGSPATGSTTAEAYGPIAFSLDGTRLYFASPNARGTLDLWVRPVSGGAGTRLTSFARDTYGPSVGKYGRVLFGVQDYRTFVAVVPADSGTIRQLTSFQSETPTWSRDDKLIGVTYGSWRRVIDDLHYPDIAQDLGVVSADAETPAAAPRAVVRASSSEDQGLDWSPNGKWIVLHSHANGLDDVWIQPADGSAPAKPITAGGTETGWPRWSPDGGWIAYGTEVRDGGRLRGVLFTVGIDSATGAVTREARQVPIVGVHGDVDQVEWASASDSIVFSAAEGRDQRAIYVVARDGGPARLIHRFTSEQQFSGLGVSPDFKWVAFIAPASDGHMQVFRVRASGGTPTQVTFDPTDKTQPAVSRDGTRIAFTVFSYRMQFWVIEP
jgi:Tol biopolymer transport system component